MRGIKTKYSVLGIMSGTSLDGLDMAVCSFELDNNTWSYSIDKSTTVSYPKSLLALLKGAFLSSAAEIAKLHSSFGRFIGEQAKLFLKENKLHVDFVASHGQTIFHVPEEGYTFQIGSGAEIAVRTGLPTVCDLRTIDVARGGQGAPLVPIGDKLLFSDYAGCLNLGGFANISYESAWGKMMAYDICPVNFVMNRLSSKLGLKFDMEGELAKSGKVIPNLLRELNANRYFTLEPPKSLGQEWVEENILMLFKDNDLIKDYLRTYCEHVSMQITDSLLTIEGDKILATGGGVYNSFLMSLIVARSEKNIVVPNAELVEMKEALIFAFLGVLRMRGEVNSLASVTGSAVDSVNGGVYLP